MVPPAVNDTRDAFEPTETKEGLDAVRHSAPMIVERPKSARQARKLLLMRIFA